MNGVPLAIAFAVSVLPVPGLPYNSTPVGHGAISLLPKINREKNNNHNNNNNNYNNNNNGNYNNNNKK